MHIDSCDNITVKEDPCPDRCGQASKSNNLETDLLTEANKSIYGIPTQYLVFLAENTRAQFPFRGIYLVLGSPISIGIKYSW